MSRSNRDFGDEDFIDYRERRGAHRPKSRGAMAAVPWVLAAVAVLGLTFAASQFLDDSDDDKTPVVAATGSKAPSTPKPDADPAPSEEPPEPSKAPEPPAPTVDRTKPIKIFNSTDSSGLAARAGDELKKSDWKIAEVGNYTGGATPTTIFYGTAALEVTAEALIADLGDQGKATLSTKYGSGITLVLGSDYQE
ncbi:MAG: LytR C-terminal domain-containing protein [Angustibacter sp.]